MSHDDIATIIFSSGSTGVPKGVVLTHAGQLWWIRALQKYWPGDPSNRALAAVPLYRLFCQVTGYAGTTQVAVVAPGPASEGASVVPPPVPFVPHAAMKIAVPASAPSEL